MRQRLPVVLALLVAITACDRTAKEQLAQVTRSDSLHTDSLVAIKNEMLNEMLASTQFLNDINAEVAKLKLPANRTLTTTLTSESQLSRVREERQAVTARIRNLVARFDSMQTRVASLQTRAAALRTRDTALTAQVAQYEKTMADLRTNLEQQRAEFQTTIDRQSVQIANLNQQVDTVTRLNTGLMADRDQLTAERVVLTASVGQLTTEVNTAYYIVGTRDELVKKGVLVEEGPRSVLGLVGSRPVVPARELDTLQFTRIDRTRDVEIPLPAGNYTIVSRQSKDFITPAASNNGMLVGSIRIDHPDRFWEPSKFLVVVRR